MNASDTSSKTLLILFYIRCKKNYYTGKVSFQSSSYHNHNKNKHVGRVNLLELTLAPSFNICDTPGAFGTCNAMFAEKITLIQYSFKVKTNFLKFGHKIVRKLSSHNNSPTNYQPAAPHYQRWFLVTESWITRYDTMCMYISGSRNIFLIHCWCTCHRYFVQN